MSYRWRLSLPEKWREASVLNQDGNMDPNLTLAHITQNTAVIQLHQCIAFPPATLRAYRVSLPSTSSAETCVSAASEIGTIAHQFLQQTRGITHPQLGFCLFIAGRVLLVHSVHHGTDIQSMFTTISAALQEIGARWESRVNKGHASSSYNNLASRLHSRLLKAQAMKNSSITSTQAVRPPLDISRPVYSEDRDRSRAASVTPADHEELQTSLPNSDEAPLLQAPCEPSQPPLSVPSLTWDAQPDLFADYDPGSELLSMPQPTGGNAIDASDVDFEWAIGLEDVFDDQFQQVSIAWV